MEKRDSDERKGPIRRFLDARFDEKRKPALSPLLLHPDGHLVMREPERAFEGAIFADENTAL